MRKNSTNGLTTLNFQQMYITNLLLFVSAYMLFPVPSLVMPEQVGVSLPQTGTIFLAFTAAMFTIGPFHAFLCNEYKWRNVLLYSTLVMLAATAGCVFADSYAKLLLLTPVQETCFGLTTTADITVAIDITASTGRSAGNMVYTWSARLGILIGAGASVLPFDFYGFYATVYLAVTVGAFSVFSASRIYITFRTSIGMGLCDMNRFLLPRAQVPTLNMLLIVFVPGVLLPLLYIGDYIALLALMILVCLTMPLVKIFIKLSHHCQRGTANTTCYLAMETGLLAGLTTAYQLADVYLLYRAAGIATTLAISFFALLTYSYYKRKRVR